MCNATKEQDEELEEWLQTDPWNRKRCPKCAAPIEKTEGCHHLVCTQCRTHICWVCLDDFRDEQECYRHLMKIHHCISLLF